MSNDIVASRPPFERPPFERPPFERRVFNRKIPAPSLRMHPSDGNRYVCPWIEDSITVHSDGNVTCGLDDPNGQRSFGNIYVQTVQEIFANPEFGQLQSKLWNGHRCMGCTLYRPATSGQAVAPRSALPSTLVVEPTVKCNIRCLNDACVANNDPKIRTRDGDMLQYEAFADLIDQLRSVLRFVYFFNYGDPFVHAEAEDMLLYLRQACPAVDVVTSTNGIPLAKPSRAAKIVASGVNTMVFTIGGITQESYERYHVAGKVDLALKGMKNILDARKAAAGHRPTVVWRYLLFRWNDSEAEIDEAIRIAEEFGVDIFHLYLTHVPHDGWSFRFAPGTPNFLKYRKYIECALDYTRALNLAEPDADGFYAEEDVAVLGHARWTSYRASMRVDGRSGWISMAFGTVRDAAHCPATLFVATPWHTCKIQVDHLQWRVLRLSVPCRYRHEAVTVSVATPDYWFPIAEMATPDGRCLGVLVRSDADQPAPDPQAQWTDTGGEPLTADDARLLAEMTGSPAADPILDLPLSGRIRENA
jgi:MoaA/NifB/PqqE/SkfB family radical SAM enzyme